MCKSRRAFVRRGRYIRSTGVEVRGIRDIRYQIVVCFQVLREKIIEKQKAIYE